jgi:hypothetical protein
LYLHRLYIVCSRYHIITHLPAATEQLAIHLPNFPAQIFSLSLLLGDEALARRAMPYFDNADISISDIGMETFFRLSEEFAFRLLLMVEEAGVEPEEYWRRKAPTFRVCQDLANIALLAMEDVLTQVYDYRSQNQLRRT